MKLLVVLSAVMACALARPGFSYSSWSLPGGLVAAPVAPVASAWASPVAPVASVWASPVAPTLAVRSLVPGVTAYSTLPSLAPFAAPLAAPAEAAEKPEAPVSKSSAPAETASDDAVAVEAAPADSPVSTESSAPAETPAPAPAEETPAPETPAPSPAPAPPAIPVSPVAVPVPAWASPVAPAPILAAPAALAVAAPVTKSQYHAQDELGNTAYGHTEPGSVHSAVQDAAGNRVGSFSYLNPTDGQVHRTDYVADGLGYRVAANDLPVAPVNLPAPVADTPEVAAARAAHLAAHSRARRSTPASTTPLATPLVARVAVAAPLAYAASWPVVSPVAALPYAAHWGLPATLTTVVNTPGHAVSYRID